MENKLNFHPYLVAEGKKLRKYHDKDAQGKFYDEFTEQEFAEKFPEVYLEECLRKFKWNGEIIK